MKRLSELTDLIYAHVDMDVLDPSEVPGVALPVPNGPTSAELEPALTEMFKYEKVGAFGVAAMPFDQQDKTRISRQAAYNLILGAVQGVKERSRRTIVLLVRGNSGGEARSSQLLIRGQTGSNPTWLICVGLAERLLTVPAGWFAGSGRASSFASKFNQLAVRLNSLPLPWARRKRWHKKLDNPQRR